MRSMEDEGLQDQLGDTQQPRVRRKAMPQTITMNWVYEKIGALYVGNLQLTEELQRVIQENAELKAKGEEGEKAAVSGNPTD